MKIKIIAFLILNLLHCYVFAEIEVVDKTFKIGGLETKEFYYGFAKGDIITFSFEELKGKSIKEIEIIKYPSSSKFMDFKSKKIDGKTIKILEKGVFKFRFYNSAIGGRICKFHITRKPKNDETKDFNTAVIWKNKYDTNYVTIQEKYLKSKDTTIVNITDQVSKVHSAGNFNGNLNSYLFTLPKNTIAWSYYIGVNQEGQKSLELATKELSEKAGPLVSKIPGYGPLAALALGGISYITQLQKGEDIDYFLVDPNNVNLFLSRQPFYYIKRGKVINESSRMLSSLNGTYHFCFENDNAITPVSVKLKIVAITTNEVWDFRPIKKRIVNSERVPTLKD